jgi:Undecaprenyl-phosphate glucose phosphotransferase
MKAHENELHFISVLSDLFILNVTILFYAVMYINFRFEERTDIYITMILLNFSWVMAYVFVRKKILYFQTASRQRILRLGKRILAFLIITSVLFLPLLSVVGHLWLYIILCIVTFAGLKVSANLIFFRLIKLRFKRSDAIRRTLLIGQNETMRKVKRMIKENPILNMRFVGFLTDNGKGKSVIGSCEQFEEIIQKEEIHVVFVALDNDENLLANCSHKEELLGLCNRLGVRLLYVPVNERMESGNYNEDKIDGLVIINPQRYPLDLAENQIKKRLFDLLFSSLVLIFIMSWLYPIVGILIKLSSKGPVLFTQKRTGINKNVFNCYKFRSMRPNEDADKKQATGNDPRITRIGRFLRKTNLDEFPQFINVFKGEMSVVGPRPHMLAHTEKYSALIDEYLVRHYVKPGITGWAQVNGYRGETDELWKMEKRVEFDKEYLMTWSFEKDFVIVWRTVFDLKAFMNAR